MSTTSVAPHSLDAEAETFPGHYWTNNLREALRDRVSRSPSLRALQLLFLVHVQLQASRETFADLGPALHADLSNHVRRDYPIAERLALWRRYVDTWPRHHSADVLNLVSQGLHQFRAIEQAAAEGPAALRALLGMPTGEEQPSGGVKIGPKPRAAGGAR